MVVEGLIGLMRGCIVALTLSFGLFVEIWEASFRDVSLFLTQSLLVLVLGLLKEVLIFC